MEERVQPEQLQQELTELRRETEEVMNLIRFVENLSTKIHGLLEEREIFETIREEFAASPDFNMSISKLSEDGSRLRVQAYTGRASGKEMRLLERMFGKPAESFEIRVDASSIYTRVVRDRETVHHSSRELVSEIFPRVFAPLIVRFFRYEGEYGVLAPLVKRGTVVGTFGMTAGSFPEHFAPSVSSLARHISSSLEMSDYLREKARATAELESTHRRMKADLEAAAVVQRSLLPRVPDIPSVRIAYSFEPSEELGGDILNVFRIGEHHLGLFVLDVSGHGVEAALLSVALNQLLLPASGDASPESSPANGQLAAALLPKTVAERLNQTFQMSVRLTQYFTLIYGVLDLRDGRFRYVSTGHPGPIYVPKNGAARALTVPGFPIGFVEDPDYEEQSIELCAGDRLYLYSDGITEALYAQHGLQVEKRLVRELTHCRGTGLQKSVTDLTSHAKELAVGSEIQDDMTVLGLEITAHPPRATKHETRKE